MSILEVPGGRLAYEVTGQGPLVVCAHGMGDSRAAFGSLTPLLVEAGYRVASLDVRGHGESSTGWPDYSQSAVAGDILALVRHLGGPAILVGSSSSAGAVPIAAAEAPEEVERVVLIGPFVGKPQLSLFLRLIQGAVMASPTLWTMYYKTLFPTAKPNKEYMQAMKRTLREPGRMAAVSGVVAPAPVHWTDRAGEVRCPVLIMMGTKDPDFPDPAAEARLAEDLLADARITMIEGGGHLPHAELPEATFAAIDAFLVKHA